MVPTTGQSLLSTPTITVRSVRDLQRLTRATPTAGSGTPYGRLPSGGDQLQIWGRLSSSQPLPDITPPATPIYHRLSEFDAPRDTINWDLKPWDDNSSNNNNPESKITSVGKAGMYVSEDFAYKPTIRRRNNHPKLVTSSDDQGYLRLKDSKEQYLLDSRSRSSTPRKARSPLSDPDAVLPRDMTSLSIGRASSELYFDCGKMSVLGTRVEQTGKCALQIGARNCEKGAESLLGKTLANAAAAAADDDDDDESRCCQAARFSWVPTTACGRPSEEPRVTNRSDVQLAKAKENRCHSRSGHSIVGEDGCLPDMDMGPAVYSLHGRAFRASRHNSRNYETPNWKLGSTLPTEDVVQTDHRQQHPNTAAVCKTDAIGGKRIRSQTFHEGKLDQLVISNSQPTTLHRAASSDKGSGSFSTDAKYATTGQDGIINTNTQPSTRRSQTSLADGELVANSSAGQQEVQGLVDEMNNNAVGGRARRSKRDRQRDKNRNRRRMSRSKSSTSSSNVACTAGFSSGGSSSNKENSSSTRLPNLASNGSSQAQRGGGGGGGGGVTAVTANNNGGVPPSLAADAADKQSKRVNLLIAIKPDNVEAEKERFMKSGFHYNPQFVYRYPPSAAVLEKLSQPCDKLMPLARKIMNNALAKFGNYETFEEVTGGRRLTRTQILETARRYLKMEGMEEEVVVRLSEDMISRACMSRVRGQPTLQVRVHDVREHWMDGLLRHEIGTHYLRSSNNRQQVWSSWRKRRELDLGPVNPTEEGLASLHSVIFRADPCLWRSTLLYYTVRQAAKMSFVELFRDLGRYVKDPNVRWDYCMRAKRGQIDTSKPGCFSKDQVYLRGGLMILKHRHSIDFHLLLKCGKVDFQDIDRLQDLAQLDNTRIPAFMADKTLYRQKLNDILVKNGLSDEELVDI